MGQGRCSCCSSSSSSSSVKLLLFMIPLIVLFGFVSVMGPRASTLVILPSHSWSWSSSSPSSSSLSSSSSSVGAANSKEVDLHSRMVMVGVQNQEEALLADHLHLNRSSPPSLDLQPAVQVQQSNSTMLIDGLNNTGMAAAEILKFNAADVAAINESDILPKKAQRKRAVTKLERLEASLQRARIAIKDPSSWNQTHQDPDFVPQGPMYYDSNAFYRSYLEMEKKFKVFVYEEGEPPVFHDGPCKSIYSTEGNFIYTMEINRQFRTKDPEKAHVFFLPFSVARMVQYVYVRDSYDFGPIRRTVIDYINLIAGRYPYWNQSLGADHFMLACHDWGPETSFSVPYLHKNSIRVLCNANTSEKFNPVKDASFPEINLQSGKLTGLIGGPSPSKRSILAFFAGGVHGPIRPILLEHWENKDEDIQVHKYLPKGVSYYNIMRKSKYCLCPSGYEVASPRIVEAIYTGCVPVLISEHYVPPFSDVLNWKSFSVTVSTRDIPNLKNILMSISTRQYIRMQRRVVQVRRHFELNSPPKRFDVFHMILHSIWLRRLNVRIRDDQTVVNTS